MVATTGFTAILLQLLPVIIGALLDAAMKYMQQNRAYVDTVSLGQAQTANTVSTNTINAQQRANEAQTNAPGMDDIITSLGTGNF